MMKVKGIFAVSFIAMMVVGGAYANIASQGYVDQQIGTRQVAGDYATNTALGNVRTTATKAQSTATAAQTAAANAQKTADAKVSTAQGSSAANKAVITNASGNITTGTISSAMITDGTITNADIATNAAIAQSKISGLTTALAGKANTADVPTKTSDLTNDSGFITAGELPDEYTLPVATTSALGGVKSGGDITVASTGAVTVNSATQADSATKATQDASGNVITTTYATKDELTSGLAGKQATLTSAQLNAVNSGITSAKVSTYDGYNAKITAAQNAADSKVATAQGSSAANKAVITNASGNITTGTIASGMIANDAVTSAKIATGAVGADALAANAVTSAKIADGTITNADIATNAAIAASKISGLSTVATTGSYDDLADKPTIPSAYVLKAATSSALGGVKSGGDITVATSGAVTVNSATQADSATKATQDASGNVITTTYATKSELTNGLSGKQATLSGAQLNAVNSGITSTKVSTYDGYNAKITAAQTAADDAADAADAAQTAAETAQSTATAAQNAANAKVATAQGSAAANKAVITNSSGNITTGQIASGMIENDAVTSAKIATGAVDATALASGAVTSAKIADGTIVNADISASAAIAASKISGLATVATSGSYDDLTDKPTIPAAITVDSALSSTSTNPVQNKVINTALAGKLSTTGTAAKATADANGNNIANTYATKAQLTALDSTSTGTGAVVTGVSQKDGKVSVTKGNVQIPVGSATATTYATIWVQ